MSELVRRREDGELPQHLSAIVDMFARYTAPDAEPRCELVMLTHSVMLPTGAWQNDVIAEHRWLHLKDAEMLRTEIEDKAAEFLRAARDHAQTLDRPQRYAVVCYGAKSKWLRRHDMRISPGSLAEGVFGESEPATVHGVLATSLRYNEGLTRSTFAKDSDLFALFKRENDTLREENEKLRREIASMRDQAFAHMRQTQEMMLMRAKLELESERRKLDPMRATLERDSKLWTMAEGVLGKVTESVTGSPLLGAAAGPVAQFIRSLSDDKVTQMLAPLDDGERTRLYQALGVLPSAMANGVGS